jgi:hypothetical protein
VNLTCVHPPFRTHLCCFFSAGFSDGDDTDGSDELDFSATGRGSVTSNASNGTDTTSGLSRNRSGSIYNGFDDPSPTPPDEPIRETVTTTGNPAIVANEIGGDGSVDDSNEEDGFQLDPAEQAQLDTEHKIVYSKDLAFANELSADFEQEEEDAQREQLASLLRVRGGGGLDDTLQQIDFSSVVEPVDWSEGADNGSSKVSTKGDLQRAGSHYGGSITSPLTSPKVKVVKPEKPTKAPKGKAAPLQASKTSKPATETASAAVTSKAQQRLQDRAALKAKLAKEIKTTASPAKSAPKVGSIPNWGEKEVLAWLVTIVDEDGMTTWKDIISAEVIDGPKLLGLAEADLKQYTKGYLTLKADLSIVMEGIRRLNIEGAKAGKKTLRRAIGKKLGL